LPQNEINNLLLKINEKEDFIQTSKKEINLLKKSNETLLLQSQTIIKNKKLQSSNDTSSKMIILVFIIFVILSLMLNKFLQSAARDRVTVVPV